MTATDVILPIVQGVVTLMIITLILWGLYQFFKFLGLIKLIIKLFKRKTEITEEEYDEVIEILKDRNSLIYFSEYLSKFPKAKQERYMNAYLEIMKLKEDLEIKQTKENLERRK